MNDEGMGSIPAALEVARTRVSFDWLTSVDGRLYWVETSLETGRAALVTWSARSVSVLRGGGVGSGLHAYGGMPYAVLSSGEAVVVDESSGRLAGAVTIPAAEQVYGDLTWSGGELLGVREGAAGDALFAVGSRHLRILETTDGFLASPRVSADRLAWVRWGADVMPWDSGEVLVAQYAAGGLPMAPVRIAGGAGESALQPQWGRKGG